MKVELGLVLMLLSSAVAQTPAEDFIAAGHWKRARALVEPRLREHPDDPLANFLMSQIRFAFGDRDAPLALAEKALALDPHTAKYHRQLAEALGVQAQHANLFQQALLAHRFRKEIDTALALDPRDVQALRDLREYYLLAPGLIGGDRGKAREVVARISRIDAAEGFLADNRPADAVAAVPDNYRARIALAAFYSAPAHRNPEAAEKQAREAIRIDPGRVDAYTALAVLYAESGRWSDLDGLLAEAERAVPDDLSPYYRAADSLAARGAESYRAARYLRKYLSQPPEGNQPTLAEAEKKLARLEK